MWQKSIFNVSVFFFFFEKTRRACAQISPSPPPLRVRNIKRQRKWRKLRRKKAQKFTRTPYHHIPPPPSRRFCVGGDFGVAEIRGKEAKISEPNFGGGRGGGFFGGSAVVAGTRPTGRRIFRLLRAANSSGRELQRWAAGVHVQGCSLSKFEVE